MTTKAQLLEVVAAGYACGYGPSHLAKITGKSVRTIHLYARDLGLRLTTTRPNPPAEAPPEFLLLLLKCGMINTPVQRKFHR